MANQADLLSTFLPPEPKDIKPHPYRVERGNLIAMLHGTKELGGFIQAFSGEASELATQLEPGAIRVIM